MDLSSYKELYNQTAHDLLNRIQVNLALVQKDPHDDETITKLHIDSHSLKSQSNVMGYTKTAELCLQLEHIFRALKDKSLTMSDKLQISLNQAVSHLTQSIASIQSSGTEVDLSQDITDLQANSNILI